MKQRNFKSVIWGITLLVIAAALILESLGALSALLSIAGGISLPRILLAIVLLSFMVNDCRKHKSFRRVVWYVALLFMLFEPNIAYLCGHEDPNLINNWVILLCVLLVMIALHLLFGTRSRKWNFQWNGRDKFISGSNVVYIDCTDFQKKYVENNLGATDIYFTNIEHYTGGGTLNVENNLGQTNIRIPAAWSLSMDTESNLGQIDGPDGIGTPGGPVLHLSIENNLGHVAVHFV